MQWQSNKKKQNKSKTKSHYFRKLSTNVTLHMISGTKVITHSQVTCFHLKTKEIDFNTLTKHARAHFNEPMLLSHRTH